MYEISHEHLRKIIDSITVIRGNAQLAMEVSHIKWARYYLNDIITECDNINLLVGEVIKKK